jgi:hypothetical protein
VKERSPLFVQRAQHATTARCFPEGKEDPIPQKNMPALDKEMQMHRIEAIARHLA